MTEGAALVVARAEGLYCPAGDFYIDPSLPVDRAVITHAHADHARRGHGHYLCADAGGRILRARLGDISLQGVAYGERLAMGAARVSLHPAGHVLGSAQVRIEVGGEVWVVSGDYKLAPDPTCAAFEPVRCHTFITESTFGLPIYRWPAPGAMVAEIDAWWRENAARGRCSVLLAYAFGKAQRILASIDASIGPILLHGAVASVNDSYRAEGVALPAAQLATAAGDRKSLRTALVLAPPSAAATAWMRRFGDSASAFASGWMQVRGARRQRGVERGFALSDHADWPGLLAAVAATGAEQIIVTHGRIDPLVRYLAAQGLRARSLRIEYGSEDDAPPSSAQDEADSETLP